MIPGEACSVEWLCAETGLDAVRVLARLAELEIGGWIRRIEGSRFMRVDQNVLT
jgi:predicted Rossmann fold nucleotide-binding protein DprA/Smf involved in DNA uptake